MKNLKNTFCIALFMGLSLSAIAQESRLAFINIQRITTESIPAMNADKKMKSIFSKKEQDIIDLQKSFKDKVDKFEANALTFSEADRVFKQKELAELNRAIQRKKREFEEEVSAKRNEELQDVYAKVTAAIKQLQATEKFDVVLQEAAWFNPKIDITNKVIAILDSGSK
jgi:outer membrane protein